MTMLSPEGTQFCISRRREQLLIQEAFRHGFQSNRAKTMEYTFRMSSYKRLRSSLDLGIF
jgi:hypothetical protein